MVLREVAMKFLHEERGQALVMLASTLGVLMGFTAMAVDVGVLFRAKRNLQTAADAGAAAAALDYLYNSSATSAASAARAATAQNGFTNGTGGVVVTVNQPPASGPNAGASGYMEVIVSQPNPTYFMGVITGGNSVTVAP